MRPKPGYLGSTNAPKKSVLCTDLSKSRHVYTVGDNLRVDHGPHQGWQGTVVFAHWDGSYELSRHVLQPGLIWHWLNDHGVWWIDGRLLQEGIPGATWFPKRDIETVKVLSEEVSPLNPSANFDVRLQKDFLVDKYIVVCGAHEYKGLTGFVRSVDISARHAYVSLDAKSMTTNKQDCIPLEHLLLDVSTD